MITKQTVKKKKKKKKKIEAKPTICILLKQGTGVSSCVGDMPTWRANMREKIEETLRKYQKNDENLRKNEILLTCSCEAGYAPEIRHCQN